MSRFPTQWQCRHCRFGANPNEVDQLHPQADQLMMGANEGYDLGTNREANLDKPPNFTHDTSSRRVTLGETQATNVNVGQGFSSNMHNLSKHQNHCQQATRHESKCSRFLDFQFDCYPNSQSQLCNVEFSSFATEKNSLILL